MKDNIIYWFNLLNYLSQKSLKEDLNINEEKIKQKLFEWSKYNLLLQDSNKGFNLNDMILLSKGINYE